MEFYIKVMQFDNGVLFYLLVSTSLYFFGEG